MTGIALTEDVIDQRYETLVPTKTPEPWAFDGFLRGAGMTAMKTAIDTTFKPMALLGATGAIAYDAFTGGTDAQDRYFKAYTDIKESAADFWTPRPDEVGLAGQVTGTLLGALPGLIFAPTIALPGTFAATAEPLIEKGVPLGKAQAVGGVMAGGMAAGLFVPILGRTLPERLLVGGVGFNVAQGVAMRGASGQILKGTPAEGDFIAFNTLDILIDAGLGGAFGAFAHLSPAARAQGEAAWKQIGEWGKTLSEPDKDALLVMRQAQHVGADSLPGEPKTAEDANAHVERMKTAIEQVVREEPVNVENVKVETDTGVRDPEYGPLPARDIDADERGMTMAQEAERIRVEEGLPPPPEAPVPLEQRSVFRSVTEGMAAIGRFGVEESTAYGKVAQAFFDAMAKRVGTTADALFKEYGLKVTGEPSEGGTLTLEQPKEGEYGVPRETQETAEGGHRGAAGTARQPEELPATVSGRRPAQGWTGATRVRRAGGGAPLPVYRGAATALSPRSFLPERLGGATGRPSSGLGVWFTASRAEASQYGSVLQEVYLDIRNPKIIRVEDLPGFESTAEATRYREQLRAEGYDGIVIAANHYKGKSTVVAFDPDQVIPTQSQPDRLYQGEAATRFYSALERQVATVQQESATPEMRQKVVKGQALFQKTGGENRGFLEMGKSGEPFALGLLENADRSTFLHESGHFFLEVSLDLGRKRDAPLELKRDIDTLFKWWGVKKSEWDDMTFEERRPFHEMFARGFEKYLGEGKAPTPELQSIFERFKEWLKEVYQTLQGLNVKLSDDVRAVMGRMLGGEVERIELPKERAARGSSLLEEIKALGGVEKDALQDITGEQRTGKGIKGIPVGFFKEGGRGLDDLATMLRDLGWPIPEDPVDGGVQALKNLIRDEVEGRPATKLGEEGKTEGEQLEATAEDVFKQYAQLEQEAAEKHEFKDTIAYRNEITRIRNQRDNDLAVVLTGEGDYVGAEARRTVAKAPDQPMVMGETADGEAQTMTAREYLDAAEEEYRQAMDDVKLYEEAAGCMTAVD